MPKIPISKQSLSLPRLQVLSQHKEWFKPYHVPGTADFSPHPILTDFYSHFFNLCQSQPLCAVDTGCGAVAGSSVAANTSWCWVVIINFGQGKPKKWRRALEADKRGANSAMHDPQLLCGRSLWASGMYYVLYTFHNPNTLRAMPSSNCCELRAIQTQSKALVNYLGKYS